MSKKKATSEPARDKNAGTTHVRLRTAYHAALQEIARKHRRTLTAELELALERYFEAEGLWPEGTPPADE